MYTDTQHTEAERAWRAASTVRVEGEMRSLAPMLRETTRASYIERYLRAVYGVH